MMQNVTETNNLNIEQSVDYISNFERQQFNINSTVGIRLPKSGSIKSRHSNKVYLSETSGRASIINERPRDVKKVGKKKGMMVD